MSDLPAYLLSDHIRQQHARDVLLVRRSWMMWCVAMVWGKGTAVGWSVGGPGMG